MTFHALFLCIFMLSSSLCVWAQPGNIKAVATFSIIGDVVKNIGGDAIDVTVLVGSDSDVHHFEPTPKESIVLNQADIIFENGYNFEHWINDLYEGSGSRAKRFELSDGISSRYYEDSRSRKDIDPHVWHDVSNVIIMARHVKKVLIELDPNHQAEYEINTQNYIAQLHALDAWIKNQVNTIPISKRHLLTSHDSLGYFARAYGLKVSGAIIPSGTTEAEDPSARQIAKLFDVIKSSGVNVIFTENIKNAKLAETIARDAKILIAPALYTDALGQQGSEGESYIKMMMHNTKVIASFLNKG